VKLTLVHPCIGRFSGDTSYIRTWQMEPLPPAVLAALTPSDVDIRFYDDRLETIPYDQDTDLVAMSVETYTARRCYQIASGFRRRGIPVVMGGFHAGLATEEVKRYADAVVIGEAEECWPRLIDDFRHGKMEKVYQTEGRPSLAVTTTDRRIFQGKRYVPVTLIEAGRGCHFRCDFCAIQTYFGATQTRRPVDRIVEEIQRLKASTKLFFFVDDNITSNMDQAKEFYRALIPLKIRWVSQASINAAHDEEFLDLIARSGCEALLIGFESLDKQTLLEMNKAFNTIHGGYEAALANLRRYKIRLYSTFVFGYDRDTEQTFQDALDFALAQKFYIAAFNHMTPFPGTPVYKRLQDEGRLRYEAWWMDPAYTYNQLPFRPKILSPEKVQELCITVRQKFYSIPQILRRWADPVNLGSFFMARNFPLINSMIRGEIGQRDGLPMGDADYQGELIEVDGAGEFVPARGN
jgi:radical SAM superfamily enzyme YgiQ (UPF0313 family)